MRNDGEAGGTGIAAAATREVARAVEGVVIIAEEGEGEDRCRTSSAYGMRLACTGVVKDACTTGRRDEDEDLSDELADICTVGEENDSIDSPADACGGSTEDAFLAA